LHINIYIVPCEHTRQVNNRRALLTKGYGTIQEMFTHCMHEDGPLRLILRVEWYRVVEKCGTAGTTIVVPDPSEPLNNHSTYVFLDSCYQQPVAVWPHDPFNRIDARDPRASYLEVVDRNQEQLFD